MNSKRCLQILLYTLVLLFNFIFVHTHMSSQQGYSALSSLKHVRTKEDLISYAGSVQGNTVIIIFTKTTCPPCNAYKPILEKFFQRKPQYMPYFVMCIIDDDMIRNPSYVSVPKLFREVSSIPTTLPVKLSPNGTFSVIAQPGIGVISAIDEYAAAALPFVKQ